MHPEVKAYIENSTESHQAILTELRKLIFSIAPGFFEFAKIKTNQHLIEGTGKSMRHVKLSKVEDIKAFQVSEMIKEVLK